MTFSIRVVQLEPVNPVSTFLKGQAVFEGDWTPELGQTSFGQHTCQNAKQTLFSALAWNLQGREPAFKALIFDPAKQKVLETPELTGFCTRLGFTSKDHLVVSRIGHFNQVFVPKRLEVYKPAKPT